MLHTPTLVKTPFCLLFTTDTSKYLYRFSPIFSINVCMCSSLNAVTVIFQGAIWHFTKITLHRSAMKKQGFQMHTYNFQQRRLQLNNIIYSLILRP